MEKFDQINPEVLNLSEEERRERMKEKVRKELEDEYDKENSEGEGEVDSIKSAEYLQRKEKWVLGQINDNEELEESNNERENALRRAKIHELTGLENRPEFFKLMNNYFENIFGKEVLQNREAFIEAIKNREVNSEDEKMIVAYCDLSYLAEANAQGGHAKGDNLLKNTADVLKKKGGKSYNFGGDEMLVFYNKEAKDVQESIVAIENGVKNLENTEYLRVLGLEPNIDIGLANLSESIEIFKSLIKQLSVSKEGVEALSSVSPVKALQNIWVDLADKRAFIKKGMSRLPLLINLKKRHSNIYDKVIGTTRKGGYSATDIEIDKLDEDKNEKKIIDFIKEKEDEKLKIEKGLFDRIRAELILKKALENF